MLEKIVHQGKLLSIIVRGGFDKPGVHFFTDEKSGQQLASMRHQKGTRITPHLHNPVPREVLYTNEVLFIKQGKLRVDFYDDARNYISSRILEGGDTILLAAAGHGFEVLEELVMIEVKQGPYAGDEDKVRFDSVAPEMVCIGGDRDG